MERNNKMEIRKLILCLGASLLLVLQSCNTQMQKPIQNYFFGTWKSAENAELIFNNNGTFIGINLPAELGFFPADSFRNIKFGGSGKWILKKGNTNWEINLDFDKVSGINKNGCSFPLLIAGRRGIMDNKPPWYIFAWKEEEGGERYKFLKQ